MEAGTVWINQHLVVNPNVPFGGNKDSGFGVQYGAEGLKEYCYLRVISSQDLRSISAIWRELQPSYRFTPTPNPALFQPSLAPAIEAAGRSTRKKPNDLSVRYL